MVSREHWAKKKRLLAVLIFTSLCIVDLSNFFNVRLWAISFIFLYLIWFYRFYLNNPSPDLNILGVKIDKSVFFLFSILLIKLLFQIYLYNKGFILFTSDSSCRTIAAYKWSLRPHLVQFCGDVWLPFYLYLHGLLFMLVDDVLWVPRLTSFLASCMLLIYFYKFIRCIFPERHVCYISVLILLFYPWYVWVSSTIMLETYYLAFLAGGLYYITLWLKKDRTRYLLLSSVFFILSSGFHFQSWPAINAVNLFMLYFLVIFYRQKDFRRVKRLVLFFFLNNLWIIIYVLGTYFSTGTMNVFKEHMERLGSLFRWSGPSIFSKLAYYPALVVKNGPFIMWALLLAGLFYIIKNRKNIIGMFPLLVAVITLIAFSIYNLLLHPTAAAPNRYCLVFVILLIPYMAYGFNHIFSWNRPGIANKVNRRNIGTLRFFSVFILGFILFLNTAQSLKLCISREKKRSIIFRSSVNAGTYINELFNSSGLDKDSKFMIEKASGFWHVILTARHPYHVIYDKNLTEVKEHLLANNVKYVIVKSKGLKTRLKKKLPFALKEKTFGRWTIYKIGLRWT